MSPVRAAQVFEEALRAVSPARLLVAFSGGVDSTALLLLAREHAHRAGLPLHALHVNHQVHPDAHAWEGHCRTVCRELDVALEIERLEPAGREPSEGVLRDRRYAVFERRLGEGDALLTGHQRDDVAETLLLNLLRGAGLDGLAAVPARRVLGAGLVLRPLLAVTRSELIALVSAAGLTWIEDPSNRDTRLRRNFLRHRIMPLLAERWPGASATLARAAALAREGATLLEQTLARDLAAVRSGDPAVLALAPLREFDGPRQRALVRAWLRELGLGPPPRARLDELLRQLECAGPSAQPLIRYGTVELRRYRHGLYARRVPPPLDAGVRIDWHTPVLELPAQCGRLEWRRDNGGAPLDPPRLEVRFRAADKRLKPAGGRHRRPLRLLFQEAGVPPWDRPRCPLIYVGERLIGVGDLYWTDEFEAIQRELGARYRWRRAFRLDPPSAVG